MILNPARAEAQVLFRSPRMGRNYPRRTWATEFGGGDAESTGGSMQTVNRPMIMASTISAGCARRVSIASTALLTQRLTTPWRSRRHETRFATQPSSNSGSASMSSASSANPLVHSISATPALPGVRWLWSYYSLSQYEW